MRVAEQAWSVSLNGRERRRHSRAFPLSEDLPPITLRRLDDDHYVVESRGPQAEPIRLAKRGAWEQFSTRDPARTAHRFSTRESALNALSRGERDDNAQRAGLTEMEGHGAAA